MNALAFELPASLEATTPPEARGLARDGVRMMVASRSVGAVVHARFHQLPAFLDAGDVIVVNTSATLPAAVAARRADGSDVRVHFATPAPGLPADGWWVVEVRTPDGAHPYRCARSGDRLALAGGGEIELAAPYASSCRLWLARLRLGAPVPVYLADHGAPIRYGYVTDEWPLAAYQTAFAVEAGSAEMPSAGRPFTPELITALVALGVQIAPLTLHTGVSSPERQEAPYPERYEVPPATARLVNSARAAGARVIAVGTTAVRALETSVTPDGAVRSSSGWTRLVVTPERGLRVVDGIISGWHEPEASHLQLLEAAAGAELLERCYAEAVRTGYLWHEFGDSHLVLP
jgi:S-adenosylmethionine:tRNA ribosyltransferase-isomerase